jgi:hypothetical protein
VVVPWGSADQSRNALMEVVSTSEARIRKVASEVVGVLIDSRRGVPDPHGVVRAVVEIPQSARSAETSEPSWIND